MARDKYETKKELLEDLWAGLDQLEDEVFQDLKIAALNGDTDAYYRACRKANLIDQNLLIYKRLRSGRR